MAEPGGDREFHPSVLHLGIHAGLHVQTSMAVGSSSGNGESKTSKLDIPLGRSRRSAIQTPGRFQTRFDMCKCPLTNCIQHDPETRQNFGFTDAAKSLIVATHARSTFKPTSRAAMSSAKDIIQGFKRHPGLKFRAAQMT